MTEKTTYEIVDLTAEIQRITNDNMESLSDSLTESFEETLENDYVSKNDVGEVVTDNEKLVRGQDLINYINTILGNYVEDSDLEDYANTTTLKNYVTQEQLNNIQLNLEGHSFKYPLETQTPINKLINAGYYKYVGEYDAVGSTFNCAPDDAIPYAQSLIRVEKQSNHIIQHIYSTSPDTNFNYKIDGREYIRHGYLLPDNNNDIVTNWDEWKVSHLPWKKRDDLLNEKGENVDPNSFEIYECTAGYVFKWTQKSVDNRFILPMNQYTYSTVYTFKKNLPICDPVIFSNFIGHMDLKISKNKIEIRSSSNKGEYIVGVDGSYFVPRTN